MHTAWTIFWSYDLMMSFNMRWLQWVKGNSTVLRTKNDQTPTFPNHLTFQFTSKSPMFIQKEASFKIWLTIQKKHRFARSSPLNHIFPMICGIPTVAKKLDPRCTCATSAVTPAWRRFSSSLRHLPAMNWAKAWRVRKTWRNMRNDRFHHNMFETNVEKWVDLRDSSNHEVIELYSSNKTWHETNMWISHRHWDS